MKKAVINTMKKMQIKTIITLSYVLLILIVTTMMSIILCVAFDLITDRHIKSTIEAEEDLAKQRIRMGREVIMPYARSYILLKAEIIASELEKKLKKYKDDRDYANLRNDPEIVKIATRHIYNQNVDAGYTYLIDRSGTVVLSTDKSEEGLNFKKFRTRFPSLYRLLEKATTEKVPTEGYYSYFNPAETEVERKFLVAADVVDTPFMVVASVYVNKFYSPINTFIANAQTKELTELKDEIDSTFFESLVFILFISLLIISVITVVIIIFGFFLANLIASPLIRLCEGISIFGEGHFIFEGEEYGSREIVQLTRSFKHLGRQLTTYMENLRQEILSRQAVEAEVKIGRRIQAAMLQQNTLETPHPDFEIYVSLAPAREVAGDFYDFFFLDEGKTRIALVIADASGKGIPAAIFMAMAKTVLSNNLCFLSDRPATVLERVNTQINNSEFMFITVFVAIYDITAGILTYANGGHHNTIKVSAGGEIREFGELGDTCIGMFPDLTFHEGTETLDPGDVLLLYTDGITEARSPEEQDYGEERLKQLLVGNRDKSMKELSDIICSDVREFEKGNPFDDVTVLLFRRNR